MAWALDPYPGVRVAVVKPDTTSAVRFDAPFAYDRAQTLLLRTPGVARSNLLFLVACLSVGMLLQLSSRTPANAHQALNAAFVHVSLPAATLQALHSFAVDPNHLRPVLMPWALFAVGAAAFWCVDSGCTCRAPA